MEYSPILYLRLLTGTDSVSQEHFNFNFATVDTALQEFAATLDSFDPEVTEDDLKKLATMVEFSSEHLAEIGASVQFNAAQLQLISQYLDLNQLETLASFLTLSVSDLEQMVGNLSDSQLEKMGEAIFLTEEQVATFLGELELTELQLASIINGADDSTLSEIAEKMQLSVSDLQSICEKLSESQLKIMGESVSLTEEQIQTFLGEVELTASQLSTIINGANQETLQEIADKINLSLSDLQGICEKLSDSQLETMGESVSLTEEQIQTFLGEVELTELQLASMINGADNETLGKIAEKMQLSVADLQSICEKLSESQLETMGKSVSLTEEQIQTFLREVELTASQLSTIINGANQETLQEIAEKIVFSQEILDSFKGEKGDDGDTAEFTPEQEALIEAAIVGAVAKQDRLTELSDITDFMKESDEITIIQDDMVKKISPVNFASYMNSLSPLPEVGRTLDGYSWEEIWQIAQLGKMEDYFQIGDKKTWFCNAVSTTVQIAGFWHDVKNAETGQRANVSFVLNSLVYVTDEELSAHFDSSQRDYVAYDTSCLALRDVMWTDGALYQRLLSDGFGDFITPVYKNSGGGSANAILYTGDMVSAEPFAFFPLGLYDVFYSSSSFQDRYTGESVNHYYPLLNSTSNNYNILQSAIAKATFLIRNTTSTAKLTFLSTSGVGTITTVPTVYTVQTADSGYRNLFVGFAMG